METKFLLVNNLTESLILSVFDYNDHRKDSELGFATFDLSKLREDAVHEGLEDVIRKDGKDKGVLRFDVSFFPVLKPDTAGTEQIPDSSKCLRRHKALRLHSSPIYDLSSQRLA